MIAMELSAPDLVLDGAPPVRLRVRPGALTDAKTTRLKEILAEHPGESQVFVHLESQEKTTVVRLGDEFCVSDRNGLFAELRVLLGPDCVLLRWSRGPPSCTTTARSHDRALRAARAGDEPDRAGDGLGDRARVRAALLVPARLPTGRGVGRRRRATRAPAGPLATPPVLDFTSRRPPTSAGSATPPVRVRVRAGAVRAVGRGGGAVGRDRRRFARRPSSRWATSSPPTRPRASSSASRPDLGGRRAEVLTSGLPFSIVRWSRRGVT